MLFLVLAIIAALVIVEAATAVKPEWPDHRVGDPVPQRPGPDDPPFHRTPLAPTYAERRALFLAWVSGHATPDSREGIWTDLAKLEHGHAGVSDVALQEALSFVNARNDTADFVVAGLIRLYYKHAGTGRLSPEQVSAIEHALLDFKYWLDEPNPTEMELWTENHQILAYSAEYLAGQLFPDETFTNNSQTGRWHVAQAGLRILRWIDWHARTGLAEWDSIPYLTKDVAALLNLVDFSHDEEIARRAAMMVDLLLFDVAVDSFYGQYGTSHGRIAGHHVKSADGDSIVTLQALAWAGFRGRHTGD
jgi:hypothetical protein